MNKQAILHIVDSSYCFPTSSKEIVLRLRAAKGDLKEAKVIYESKYVIAESRKEAIMKKAYTGELFDYYEVKLNLDDTRLAYVFYVNDGENNYYISEDGATETYDFSIGYYNFFQYPFINEADIHNGVDWMKNAVFYQIFVDRFNIGNRNKDMTYINCKWGDKPTPKSLAGGDIKGITEKLDYIKNLGVTAIYLTPIFKSVSNHKYDISDYFKIDEQFGTEEHLKELVDEAHRKGIRIILDAVFNHCSEEISLFQDVIKKGRNSKYFDWFIIDGDSISQSRDNYEMFASCEYMPKFNTSNSEVQQYLINIGKYYIEKFDIDGWRLDVSDEVSHNFWRKFREEIKTLKPDTVIIGENWHDANTNLRGDQFDSIMNYAYTKSCLDYFATEEKNAEMLAFKLNDILMRNTDTVNRMMMNLIDSHDTHRFFSEVKENRFKMKAALSMLYLFPGNPCIFYGTEILTPGGYDPDCRKCMNWEKANDESEYRDIYKILRYLADIRKKYDISSSTVEIHSDNDNFMLVNYVNNNKIELIVNLVEETIRLKINEGDEYICIHGKEQYLGL